MSLLEFFLITFRASLFSTSGMGNLPAMHDDLVTMRGWMTDRQIAEALSVGQVSPGPSGLWVVSLGYLSGGLRGALLATVAICLPPLLVIPLGRLYARAQSHPAVEGFIRGLGAAVVGVFAVVLLLILARAGVTGVSLSIAAAALALAATGRVPVILILALGAAAGIALNGSS